MINCTPLNAEHRALGARMVDFGGWDMPINYGSQVEEHHQVRRDAGMFDVSHMTVIDLRGARVREFLRRLVANSVDKLAKPGKALYTCMLDEQGGVIDDLIVYYLDDGFFRLVVNASTRDKDVDWITRHAAGFDVEVDVRDELAMIAVQGPTARERVHGVLPAEARDGATRLVRFGALSSGGLFIARTGYTGEEGYEIVMPADRAVGFWRDLLAAGVKPAGLGARDTLRLEAGMNLYGQDMDQSTTPLESGLAWTVAFDADRDFIGRGALEAQRDAGVPRKLVGVVLDDKGVLRHDQIVASGAGEGRILSGSFAPTLGKSIGLARVPAAAGDDLHVAIRDRSLPLRVVTPPFVRGGQPAAGI